MMDRFTTIFFGKWLVLLFFGAQSYWQVDGLLKDASTGRVIETLSWIALSVLLFFIAWKIGWSNLRALGTKVQRRRRRLAVITAIPLSIAGVRLLITHDPFLWAIGTLFMLVPIVGLIYLMSRWYTRDTGAPQPVAPPAGTD